jgi:serine/threonine protein kinase
MLSFDPSTRISIKELEEHSFPSEYILINQQSESHQINEDSNHDFNSKEGKYKAESQHLIDEIHKFKQENLKENIINSQQKQFSIITNLIDISHDFEQSCSINQLENTVFSLTNIHPQFNNNRDIFIQFRTDKQKLEKCFQKFKQQADQYKVTEALAKVSACYIRGIRTKNNQNQGLHLLKSPNSNLNRRIILVCSSCYKGKSYNLFNLFNFFKITLIINFSYK